MSDFKVLDALTWQKQETRCPELETWFASERVMAQGMPDFVRWLVPPDYQPLPGKQKW